jgi:hypothetical protein
MQAQFQDKGGPDKWADMIQTGPHTKGPWDCYRNQGFRGCGPDTTDCGQGWEKKVWIGAFATFSFPAILGTLVCMVRMVLLNRALMISKSPPGTLPKRPSLGTLPM